MTDAELLRNIRTWWVTSDYSRIEDLFNNFKPEDIGNVKRCCQLMLLMAETSEIDQVRRVRDETIDRLDPYWREEFDGDDWLSRFRSTSPYSKKCSHLPSLEDFQRRGTITRRRLEQPTEGEK